MTQFHSNFSSYSTYTPDQTEDAPSPTSPVRNNDSFSRVTIVDGVSTAEESKKVSTFDSNDINPYASDDWRSTARNQSGSPTVDINDDTLITMHGMQTTAAILSRAGMLEKDSNGVYSLPTEKTRQAVPAAELAEHRLHDAVLPAGADAIVNEALDGVTDSGVAGLTGTAISFALGNISADRIAHQISKMTGCGVEAGAAKMATIQAVYQTQADDYLVAQHGIARGELHDFYEFARGHSNKDALRTALNNQIYSKRMDGYKGLVKAYLSKTAPNTQSLNAGGIETQLSTDGKELVKVHGMWMQSKVAAMNGWI